MLSQPIFWQYSGVIIPQVTDKHEKKSPRPPLDAVVKRFYAIRIPRGIPLQYSSSPFAKNTLRSDDVETGAEQFYRGTRVFIPEMSLLVAKNV